MTTSGAHGAVLLGLMTALASCAAHQPATSTPAPQPTARAAGQPDPLAPFAGTIVTTRQRMTQFRSVSEFVAGIRAVQADRLSANELDDGVNRLWYVHFAAFFARGSTKGELHFKFFDLTGGKRELVAEGTWPLLGPPGGRAVYGDVQLAEPWFVPERRYEMIVDVDRIATASTSFWLLAKREAAPHAPTARATPPTPAPSSQSPAIAAASPHDELQDTVNGARRVSGSTACAPVKPRDPSWVDAEDRGLRSSPGLRFTGLDKDMVRKIIRNHVPAIRACYEASMDEPPYPQGKLRSRFVIGPDGSVRGSCALDSDLKNTALEQCILDEVLTMKFPETIDQGVVVVEYPFVLVPKDDDDDAAPKPRPKRERQNHRR